MRNVRASLPLVLLLLAVRTQSADAGQEPESSQAVYYDHDGNYYGIFLDSLTFVEASVVCASKKGKLLEFDKAGVAEFAARALSESVAGLSSVWIGARFYPGRKQLLVEDRKQAQMTRYYSLEPGHWAWLTGGDIPSGPYDKGVKFPMEEPPYWANAPNLTLLEDLCLVMDKDRKHRPIVVGLSCAVKRPFVCSLPVESYKRRPVEVLPPVEVKGKLFHLFQGHHTWAEAMVYCRKIGLQFAAVTEKAEFDEILRRMRRARPVMTSAWVGGLVVDSEWRWISRSQDTAATIAEGVSEWKWPPNSTSSNCLLADIGVTMQSITLIEAQCVRKSNFLCEAAQLTGTQDLIHIPGSLYWISTIPLPWYEAKRRCYTCLKNGTLFQPIEELYEMKSIVQFLVKGMTELSTSVLEHIWMNGRLTGRYFWWLGQSSRTADGPGVGDGKFLLDHTGDFQADPGLSDFACLNGDRQSGGQFSLYGVQCNYSQYFVCTDWNLKNKGDFLEQSCRH